MPQWRAFANWRLVSGLRIWPLPERNCRKSLATCRNIPNFGRRRPETGIDPHCMADQAALQPLLKQFPTQIISENIPKNSEFSNGIRDYNSRIQTITNRWRFDGPISLGLA